MHEAAAFNSAQVGLCWRSCFCSLSASKIHAWVMEDRRLGSCYLQTYIETSSIVRIWFDSLEGHIDILLFRRNCSTRKFIKQGLAEVLAFPIFLKVSFHFNYCLSSLWTLCCYSNVCLLIPNSSFSLSLNFALDFFALPSPDLLFFSWVQTLICRH